MYLQIKKIRKTQWDFNKGNNLTISMIGLYDDDWKYKRRIKLNDAAIEKLLEVKIPIEHLDSTLKQNDKTN